MSTSRQVPPSEPKERSKQTENRVERKGAAMTKYQSGDIVGYKLDDTARPGIARVRVVKPVSSEDWPYTRPMPAGQLYRVEFLGLARRSSVVGVRCPCSGLRREVGEARLVPFSEV